MIYYYRKHLLHIIASATLPLICLITSCDDINLYPDLPNPQNGTASETNQDNPGEHTVDPIPNPTPEPTPTAPEPTTPPEYNYIIFKGKEFKLDSLSITEDEYGCDDCVNFRYTYEKHYILTSGNISFDFRFSTIGSYYDIRQRVYDFDEEHYISGKTTLFAYVKNLNPDGGLYSLEFYSGKLTFSNPESSVETDIISENMKVEIMQESFAVSPMTVHYLAKNGSIGSAGSNPGGSGGSGTTCTSSQMNCGGVCKNVKTDKFNCGGCGNLCDHRWGATQKCVNGSCQWSCDAGYIQCGTSSSPNCVYGNKCH